MNNQTSNLKDADLDLAIGGSFSCQLFGWKFEITDPSPDVVRHGNTIRFDPVVSVTRV
jgi:hypothetical protein